MEARFFSKELCKRFVEDTRLPMPVVNDPEMFMYYVKLYEEDYGSMTLYENMCDEIDLDYNGKAEDFIQVFYDSRKRMIDEMHESHAYKEFLSCDMSRFSVCNELKNVKKGNIYNAENVGKWFLSIDLKKANFQALRYFNKDLVFGSDSYDEYVSRYTLSEYMQESKHTREVVFGQCKPERQITIEKHLVSKFYECFGYNKDIMKPVRFDTDEIVFEINDSDNDFVKYRQLFESALRVLIGEASDKSGVKVSNSLFRLGAMCLRSKRTGKYRNLNYILKDINGKTSFKCVPLTYHSIVYKLFNGMKTEKNDYYFRYEGLDAYIDDDFELLVIDTRDEAVEKENNNKKKIN